jgi:radical SAM superfamily enzyme YgiQ (UPF0313 family)
VKLLLINPKFPESFWSFKWAIDNFFPAKRTLNPPLGLATLAALCPDHWDVEIVDENIESIPLQPDADIVGVCGMGVQFARQKELLAFYRSKGHFVVAGGSYASLCPEEYETLADAIIAGEAEYIWPSLADSPTPRFDLLDLHKYRTVSLQFSRGCPFRCEFCDIIVMFGRKPRTKPLEQVGRELDKLREQGAGAVFFVDDNLIGNRPRAKDLLRFLVDYQKKHNYRFHFGTEASMNLARDEEMMELLRAANFEWIFFGIESPDEDSLKETKKMQNTSQDLLESVRTIYSYGIDILAGFIIGFDNDTTKTFDKQYQFITKSGIQSAMIGLLTAIPKTPLYERLEAEGRLIADAGTSTSDNSKLSTNVSPKGMTYDEMIDGYHALHYRLFSDRGIADRVRSKLGQLREPQFGSEFTVRQSLYILRRFVTQALVPGGAGRVFHFLRTLPLTRPRQLPLVISDWIVGLAMHDYMERHFVQEFETDGHRARGYIDRMREALLDRRHKGALGVSFEEFENKATSVWISMKGRLEPTSFRSVAEHAEHLLRDTRATLTINIASFHDGPQVEHLKQLLERLSRYGDRIHILADDASRRIIGIDSSVFHLGLQSD